MGTLVARSLVAQLSSAPTVKFWSDDGAVPLSPNLVRIFENINKEVYKILQQNVFTELKSKNIFPCE